MLRLLKLFRTAVLGSSFSLLGACATSLTASAVVLDVQLDEDKQQLYLSNAVQRSNPKIVALPGRGFEGACGARIDAHDYIVLFDDNGRLSQWVVGPDGGSLSAVRNLLGSVANLDCYIDAQTQALYVLEEAVGVWRYWAHPESEGERQLVAQYAPAGDLDPDVETFTVQSGGLKVGDLPIPSDYRHIRTRALPTVSARYETEPVERRGDAADDPAVWFDPSSPRNSLLLGADKRVGLRVYDLLGNERTHLPVGRINNVDVRSVAGHADVAAIAAGSNRTNGTVSLFGISHDGAVSWLESAEIETGLDDPYGLCLYRGDSRSLYVFVNDKDGRFQQWQLPQDPTLAGARLVREFVLESQPEGCVADDASHRLFYGIEDDGLFSTGAAPTAQFAPVRLADTDSGVLYADVEGMALYQQGDAGYLIVSSQGDDSYAVFDRLPPHSHRGSFRVAIDLKRAIDGVSETDGLDAHSGSFGEDFPEGILALQDGHNVYPQANQNFKLVDWRDVKRALAL